MSPVATKMTTRSRVWPVLLKNSLNLAPVPADWQQQHQQQQQQQHVESHRQDKSLEPPAAKLRRLFDNLTRVDCKQTVSRYLQCCTSSGGGCFGGGGSGGSARASGSCSCGPGASDIFCVAGAITVITGSLIAGFGVFPKNQARIRLYLESIGCAMVIVGMLIVFMSRKMQPPTSRRRGDENRSDTWLKSNRGEDAAGGRVGRRLRRSSSHSSSLATIGSSCQKQSAFLEMQASSSSWQRRSPGPQPTAAAPKRHQQHDDSVGSPAIVEMYNEEQEEQEQEQEDASQMLAEFSEIASLPAGLVAGGPVVGFRKRSSWRQAAETTTLSATDLKGSFIEHEIDGSRWIPDDDYGYGDDHQAAIEAVLSIVLTVSTLVGFRSDHSVHNHCCLHHAVQHKINARKWLHRLRREAARHHQHQLSIGQAMPMEQAETSLIELCPSDSVGRIAGAEGMDFNLAAVAQQLPSSTTGMQLVGFNKPDQQEATDSPSPDDGFGGKFFLA